MTTPNTPVADARGLDAAKLAVSWVNPLEHAAEIKDLFVTHERPEFPAFFDRAYPEAVAEGARSWVGRDESGRIRSHVVQFPRRLWFENRPVRAALLGNLMVATAYRTFWPGAALLRRAVAELRESGSADFVYADPNDLARGVVKAAGLRDAGALRRVVLPLTDRHLVMALGIRAYRMVKSWQAQLVSLAVMEWRPGDEPGPEELLPVDDSRSLRPVRSTSVYRGRLADYPTPRDRWYAFYENGPPSRLIGRALVRGPDADGVAALCVWECEPLALLESLLTGLGDRLRALGGTRVESYVMAGSRVERKFRRAGFVPREEVVPLLARPFTALGSEVVEMASDWRILPVDLDR